MKTILGELEQKNKKLYESYLNTYDIAVKEWLPLVTSKMGSFNSLPHLLGVIERVELLLFSKEYCEIELSEMELYILINACLLHDIGKASIFGGGETKDGLTIEQQTFKFHKETMKCSLCTGNNCNSKVEHGQISAMVISENWYDLGIISKKVADIISVVCCFHSCVRPKECFIHNDYYIEDYGRIRARLLAALLIMGDHLDDSFKRASPEYFEKFNEIGQIGKFRNQVQYTRIDKNNRLICSVLNTRYIGEKDLFGEKPENEKSQKRANENEGVYSDDNNILYNYLLECIGKKPLPLDDTNREKAKYGVIASLMNHIAEAYRELQPIENELYVLGIPVKKWCIECDGHLFEAEYTVKNINGEETVRYKSCKYCIEPTLDIDFCNKIFFAMYNMSTSIFEKSKFSYYDIVNYLSEYTDSLDKVILAVKRIERLLKFNKDKYEVYAGEKVWWLKVREDKVTENNHTEENQRDYISRLFSAINNNEKAVKKNTASNKFEEAAPKKQFMSVDDDIVVYNRDDSIILDSYLDILLNGNNSDNNEWNNSFSRMNQYELLKNKGENPRKKVTKEKITGSFSGGLIMPNRKKKIRGSGNVVIIGEPGVGKSTLAFQIALSCTSEKNNGIAIYYSLGTPREQLIFGMLDKGEEDSVINKSNYFYENEDQGTNNKRDAYIDLCLRLKRGDPEGDIKRQILFPMLSPNGIADEGSDGKSIFRKRYKEIEEMLRAVRQYNDDVANKIKIKTVIIDSLNDLNNDPLNKAEVKKLFNLFEDNGILGIFTVGENKYHTTEEMINVDAIKYDADTVIQLRKEQYRNYTCNLFSVTKSRYVYSILGEHPYKIKNPPENPANNTDKTFSSMKKYVEVIPSVHYIITGTSSNRLENREEKSRNNTFGIENLNSILPDQYYERHSKGTAKIINISGDTGNFKSDIAMNAAFNSLLENESCIVIRMSERNYFVDNGFRVESSLLKKYSEKYSKDGAKTITFVNCEEKDIQKNTNKRDIFCWKIENQKDPSFMYEIIYKSGALLPEEFINDIIYFIIKHDIKTIILTDIKYIGVSFPFLVDSPTSGDLFLSAFIHILQNKHINLITTSSAVSFASSANELDKIQILSDAVIECKREYDQDKETVHILGEGSKISGKKCWIEVKDDIEENKITLKFKEKLADQNKDNKDMGSISLLPFEIKSPET